MDLARRADGREKVAFSKQTSVQLFPTHIQLRPASEFGTELEERVIMMPRKLRARSTGGGPGHGALLPPSLLCFLSLGFSGSRWTWLVRIALGSEEL